MVGMRVALTDVMWVVVLVVVMVEWSAAAMVDSKVGMRVDKKVASWVVAMAVG